MDIMSYLFKTNAIKFCSENKPFWYTSGKIGPYFINTHFVYGSEKDATLFLEYIDLCLKDKASLPKKLFEKVSYQYENNEIYMNVINEMVKYIKENINISEIDYISGGERRDWFFSNIIANILGKPHISIFSDSNFENTEEIFELKNKKVLHIADLITVASSYVRAWIPAIENLGSNILWSLVVVDRMQGGKKTLEEKNVKSFSLVNVDSSLFNCALNLGIINEKQVELLEGFYSNPDETMKNFLIKNPEFLENALNSDEKTKKRAKLLIDGNLYGLN